MSSPVSELPTTAASTLYFGPWYRRSPFFEKTLAAGCSAYDIYNHMYLPGYYADPVEEYWALLNDVTVWDVCVERIVEITRSGRIGVHQLADLARPDQMRRRAGQVHDRDRRGRRDRQRPGAAADRRGPLVDGPGRLGRGPVGARRRDHSGLDVTVREPEVYPIQVQGPKSRDTMRTVFGPQIDDIKYYWTLTDRGRRHPGRHQPDRLDRRGGLRDLPARPVARRRPLGPRHGGRQAAQDPPDRAVRGAPHRGRHLQLRLGHHDQRHALPGDGPGAARRGPGRRLHRQGRARGDPRQGRRPQARRHRGRRRRAPVRASPSAWRATTASRSGP